MVILLFILTQCKLNRSSEKAISRMLDIELPEKVEVLNDEYEDMGQDFSLKYTIKLSTEQMTSVTESIRKSKYYTDYKPEKKNRLESVEGNDIKGYWLKTGYGYSFKSDINSSYAFAQIDTIKMYAVFDIAID